LYKSCRKYNSIMVNKKLVSDFTARVYNGIENLGEIIMKLANGRFS